MFPSVLTPLPSVFSWLTLSKIRENPALAPEAILENLVFDITGYDVSGHVRGRPRRP